VSRSTSQPKVSSSWWRRPKNRLAGLRSGSLNSTSKSTSLVPLPASRAAEPTTSSRLTSNLRHAGNEAFLMSSVFMFRLLRPRSSSSSQIERTAPRGPHRLFEPVAHPSQTKFTINCALNTHSQVDAADDLAVAN